MSLVKLVKDAIHGTGAVIEKSISSSQKHGVLDRFLVSIPYCGKSFSC